MQVNSIRSAVSDEPARERRSPNKIELSAWRQWIASDREPQMAGDRMVGNPSDVNQGTTAGGKRIGRGQSPRSSEEAGNDRGAKEGRDVVWPDLEQASQKGPGSAARLFARTRRNTGLECSGFCPQWTACNTGERGESLRGWCDSSQTWSRVPEPVHQKATNWKAGCRRSARPVWVGGDGAIRSLSTSSVPDWRQNSCYRGLTRPGRFTTFGAMIVNIRQVALAVVVVVSDAVGACRR